jgi:hypothetical protein
MFWARRLRWRLRGAWLAPAFVLFTAVDTVVLQHLPFAGDRGPGYVGTFLIAAFLNLLVVAVLAPLLGLWLARRDPGLPRFAARDRAGVAGLAALCALLVAGGLLHRPAVRGEREALEAQAAAAQRYFAAQAPARFRDRLGEMTTWKAGEDLYRSCVPSRDGRRALCVYVETDQSPPGVRLDRSQESNEELAGPYGEILRVR